MFPNRDNCDQIGTNLRIFLEKRDIFPKIVQAGHEGPNRDNPAQIGTNHQKLRYKGVLTEYDEKTKKIKSVPLLFRY